MNNITQYLAVVTWAQKRYTINDTLIIKKGNDFTKYSKIEFLAWKKYML